MDTRDLLPIVRMYIGPQAVGSCFHIGQISLNMITEESWVISCRPLAF